MAGEQAADRPEPRERYKVAIFDATPVPGVFVVVTDAATGKRLSASAPLHAAPSMAACLIEDHREWAAAP